MVQKYNLLFIRYYSRDMQEGNIEKFAGKVYWETLRKGVNAVSHSEPSMSRCLTANQWPAEDSTILHGSRTLVGRKLMFWRPPLLPMK